MSTVEKKQTEVPKVETKKIEDWNEKYFKLDPRMAKRLQDENKKYTERKNAEKKPTRPPPKPPYPTEPVWDLLLADVKKLAPDKRDAGYDVLVKRADTVTQQIRSDVSLDAPGKKKEMAVLARLRKKIAAEKFALQVGARKTQQTQKAGAFSQATERLRTEDFLNGIEAQFSTDKVDRIAQETKANKSEFQGVVDAMRAVEAAQKALRGGTGPYTDFTKSTLDLLNVAIAYRDSHKDPKTSDGKERVKQAEAAIKAAQSVQRLVEAENKEIQKLCEQAKAMPAQEASIGIVKDLEKFLKFPYLGSENKTRIERTISELTTKMQGIVDGLLLPKGQNPPPDEVAQVLLSMPGSCKPPSSKGNSDSFFISGPDGKPKYILKPVNGESQFSDAWPPGGGAPREALLSSASDRLSQELGLDFGVPKTSVARLEDDSFAQGTKSKDKVRVGSLQEAVKVGDPPDVKQFFGDPPKKPGQKQQFRTPEEIKERIESINEEDAENMAILDFLTLNGDRHSENLLVRDPPSTQKGQTRLCPIDAGQSLPTPEAFRRGCSSMTATVPYDPENPRVEDSQSFLMQLPMAQKKFSPKQQQALAKLDPDKIAADMKADYEKCVLEAPEMAGKVDDESFELVRKSGHFLKAAAPELTPYQISQIYASGFADIMAATNKVELDKAIKAAVDNIKEYDKLGGDAALLNLRVMANNPPLSIQEKIDILQSVKGPDDHATAAVIHFNTLLKQLNGIDPYIVDSNAADKKMAGELKKKPITSQAEIKFDTYNALTSLLSWKGMGGDAMLKASLAGNDAAYAKMADTLLATKSSSFTQNQVREFLRVGGFPKLKELMGTDYDRIKDSDFEVLRKKLHELVAQE
jgi:hypothetical protein